MSFPNELESFSQIDLQTCISDWETLQQPSVETSQYLDEIETHDSYNSNTEENQLLLNKEKLQSLQINYISCSSSSTLLQNKTVSDKTSSTSFDITPISTRSSCVKVPLKTVNDNTSENCLTTYSINNSITQQSQGLYSRVSQYGGFKVPQDTSPCVPKKGLFGTNLGQRCLQVKGYELYHSNDLTHSPKSVSENTCLCIDLKSASGTCSHPTACHSPAKSTDHCLNKHYNVPKWEIDEININKFKGFNSESFHWSDYHHYLIYGFKKICLNIYTLWLKGEGWVFAALAAILTGFSAAWIEIAIKFLSDIRIGVCYGMALDRNFCCGRKSAVDFELNACSRAESPIVHMDNVSQTYWLSWSTILHAQEPILAYIIDYSIYIAVGVALAGLAAWFCQKYSTAAAGSGIPEVKTILGGFVIKNFFNVWTAIIKCVGLSLVVASGLALGKEGPLVHIACCWATLLSRFSIKYGTNEAKKRELLSAASAAGVSVAFGAPLGGVLFSLEEVSSSFPPKTLWKSFFGAVIGALSVKWLDAGGTGRLTLFEMDSVSLLGTWQIQELIPFALLGFIGGSIGTLFIKLNLYWMNQKMKYYWIANYPIYEVIIVTAVTCLINYPLHMLRVPSSTLLEEMFSRCAVNTDPDMFSLCSAKKDPEFVYTDYSLKSSILLQLGFTAIVRFIQACVTFGMGIPAGLFLPSLTVGALCGRFVGLLTIKLNEIFGFVNCHKCIQPGVYAIVGAAAMLGGATRVTISLVVIMFELTGGLSYVVPFMVAVMISKWVGDAWSEASIYERYIRLKGYPYLRHQDSYSFTARACEIMETQMIVITLEGNTVQSLQSQLQRYSFTGFPLVNTKKDYILIGFIFANKLRKALDDVTLDQQEISEETPVEFSEFITSDIYSYSSLKQSKLDKYKPKNLNNNNEDMQQRRPLILGKNGVLDSELTTVELNDTQFLNQADGQKKAEYTDSNIKKKSCVDLSHIVDGQTIQLVPQTPLGQVYNIFKQLDLRVCLFSHHGHLEGLLTKSKFLAYVERLQTQHD